MTLTSADRQRFVSELIAFENKAMEMRNRFYDFLVTHDPKGYADYSIHPFADSPAPLWRGYFELVPYVADAMVDEHAAEPSNSLYFKGPLSKTEIKYDKEAAETFASMSDNDKPQGADPEAEEEIRNLPDAFVPFIHETQNEWNEQELYINIPDAYLDDPDRWEASVLAAMAADHELAQTALATLYGKDSETLSFETSRKVTIKDSDFIKVILNPESMVAKHWEAFKHTGSKGVPVVLFISRETGAIYEGRTPWIGYKNPEAESDNFIGKTVAPNA